MRAHFFLKLQELRNICSHESVTFYDLPSVVVPGVVSGVVVLGDVTGAVVLGDITGVVVFGDVTGVGDSGVVK